MTAVIIAAIFSILGILIGHLISASHEYHEWAREEKYMIFSQMLQLATDRHIDELTVLVIRDRGNNFLNDAVSDKDLFEALYERVAAATSELGLELTRDDFTSVLASDPREELADFLLKRAGIKNDHAASISGMVTFTREFTALQERISLICGQDAVDKSALLRRAVDADSGATLSEYRSAYRAARLAFKEAARKEIQQRRFVTLRSD